MYVSHTVHGFCTEGRYDHNRQMKDLMVRPLPLKGFTRNAGIPPSPAFYFGREANHTELRHFFRKGSHTSHHLHTVFL